MCVVKLFPCFPLYLSCQRFENLYSFSCWPSSILLVFWSTIVLHPPSPLWFCCRAVVCVVCVVCRVPYMNCRVSCVVYGMSCFVCRICNVLFYASNVNCCVSCFTFGRSRVLCLTWMWCVFHGMSCVLRVVSYVLLWMWCVIRGLSCVVRGLSCVIHVRRKQSQLPMPSAS